VDRISLRFSRGLDVREGDLRVTGADGSPYATAGFKYDPQTRRRPGRWRGRSAAPTA
jgi:hypothetical protein